jgi:hypothetical protein
MAALIVTQSIIDAARKAGACAVNYIPGTPFSEIRQAHFLWAEKHIADLYAQYQRLAPVPLWALSADGYGGGDGYGFGFGDGGGGGDGFGGYGFGFGGGGYGFGFGDGGYGDGCAR